MLKHRVLSAPALAKVGGAGGKAVDAAAELADYQATRQVGEMTSDAKENSMSRRSATCAARDRTLSAKHLKECGLAAKAWATYANVSINNVKT